MNNVVYWIIWQMDHSFIRASGCSTAVSLHTVRASCPTGAMIQLYNTNLWRYARYLTNAYRRRSQRRESKEKEDTVHRWDTMTIIRC